MLADLIAAYTRERSQVWFARADSPAMESSGLSGVAAAEYVVSVAKMAQNQQKQQGAAAVELIRGADGPPASPDGKGQRVNQYA